MPNVVIQFIVIILHTRHIKQELQSLIILHTRHIKQELQSLIILHTRHIKQALQSLPRTFTRPFTATLPNLLYQHRALAVSWGVLGSIPAKSNQRIQILVEAPNCLMLYI